MPNRDKTGPEGKGPMTGRKEGIKDDEKDIDDEKELQDALDKLGVGRGPKDGTGNRSRKGTKDETKNRGKQDKS